MNSAAGLLSLLVGIVALFAVTIMFGLGYRRRSLDYYLRSTNASILQEKWGASPHNLLYAVFQDFSPTQAGLIVKDQRDLEVGRILYDATRAGYSPGETTFQLAGQDYLMFSRGTGTFQVTLHRLVENKLDLSESLASFKWTRRWFGNGLYDLPGIGLIETPIFLQGFRQRYSLKKEGKPYGELARLSRILNRGLMIKLPREVPLPFQFFVIALEFLNH